MSYFSDRWKQIERDIQKLREEQKGSNSSVFEEDDTDDDYDSDDGFYND